MRYISTRGRVQPVGFTEAVMMGLATDGGLLLPESIPTVSASTLHRWATLPFPQLAVEVMRPFIGEAFSTDTLTRLATESFATFTHPDIAPVVRVGPHAILELFHGPTLAFKDVALQFLGNLFALILEQQGGVINILGATSGDTGSAAIHGVRGKPRIRIFILHPNLRVSPMQELQMTTVVDPNVHNLAIEGSFDDGQAIVKELFNDLAFRERYHLGAINSINWARILVQIVYYFHAWGRVGGGDPDYRPIVAVPTGNFGDIFAGFVAKQMGLPLASLLLATNRNDILSRFVQQGVYQAGTVWPTVSPSMDIQVASNFERYLFHLLGGDPEAVRTALARWTSEGLLTITDDQKKRLQSDFTGCMVTEEETIAQIRTTYQDHGYLLDPHTAVGVRAAHREAARMGHPAVGDSRPQFLCLATAHPAKFADAVRLAIGQDPDLPPPLARLRELPTRSIRLPAQTQAVRHYLTSVLSPE